MLSYRVAVLVGILASCSACIPPRCPSSCSIGSTPSYSAMALVAECPAADGTANATVPDYSCPYGIAEVNATGACADGSAVGSNYVTAMCTGRGQCNFSVSIRTDFPSCDCADTATCLEHVCGYYHGAPGPNCTASDTMCAFSHECGAYCRIIPDPLPLPYTPEDGYMCATGVCARHGATCEDCSGPACPQGYRCTPCDIVCAAVYTEVCAEGEVESAGPCSLSEAREGSCVARSRCCTQTYCRRLTTSEGSSSMPAWGWALIAMGAATIVAAVAAIIVVCFCRKTDADLNTNAKQMSVVFPDVMA